MALTPGFKKFIGLVLSVGVLVGGYVYWKQMPKSAPVIVQQEQIQEVQQPPAPVVQEAPAPVVQATPAPANVPAHTQQDVSSNRGLGAVLEAGKK